MNLRKTNCIQPYIWHSNFDFEHKFCEEEHAFEEYAQVFPSFVLGHGVMFSIYAGFLNVDVLRGCRFFE